MRQKKALAIALVLVLVLSLLPAVSLAEPAPEDQPEPAPAVTVNLYHTGDIHGNAAADTDTIGYARMQTYIKQDEADGKLLVDAGDAFHGNNFANLSKGQSIADIMKEMGYDAFVPGLHDFSYGLTALQKLVDASGADGLSVNIMQSGEPLFDAYHIYTAGGMKIGVLGISSPAMAGEDDASVAAGLNILDGDLLYQKTQQAVDELRAEGVNAIVALTHLGTQPAGGQSSSVDIATHVTGIDLIVDGNTYDAYPEGYVDYPGYTPGQTPVIVSSGSSFEDFGVTQLIFDENAHLLEIVPSIVNTGAVLDTTPDKTVSNLINTYDQEHQTFLERKAGGTPVFLNGERDFVRTGETNLSTLLTMAMVDTTGADAALLSAGSIRTSIPAGDVTAAEINNAIPSGNYVVTTKVSGAELKRILNEHMVLEQADFPQFYGIKVVAEKYLTQDGVYAARVTSMTKDGEEIADSDQLIIAVTDDIFNGKDGYVFSAQPFNEYGTLYDIFSDYLKDATPELIEAIPESAQLTLLEETIDADSIVGKLQLSIPVDLHVDLKQAVTVPENVLYALIGQDRNLVFTVHAKYPYSFIFNGDTLGTPANVSLEAEVSQTAPAGKRRASTADKYAFFVDLSDNLTLPASAYMQVYVGNAYEPGSTVYIYYYDQNNDILPYDIDGLVVGDDGSITFPAAAGSTYLINSRLLNAATSFDLPTPEQPYTLGILIICIAFAAWAVFFLITKKGSQYKK